MKFCLIFSLYICTICAKETLIRLPRVEEVEFTKRNLGPRIIGGELARAGQFPWHVAIYKRTADGRYFCAGALISDVWILTAAQCVYEAIEFTIQFGSNQLSSEDSNRVIVATSTYVIEPRFDPTVNLAHDVAVIKLRMPIEFTDYIQPIGYATMGYLYPGRPLEAVGWGHTSDDAAGLMNDLHYTEVAVIDQHECQTYYGSQLWGSMICAEGNYNEGICYGDIGGALVTPVHDWIGNHSIAVAIASWVSQNGCESLDPKGHTRIDSYFNWIVNATRDN